jgi:hypothetical protein
MIYSLLISVTIFITVIVSGYIYSENFSSYLPEIKPKELKSKYSFPEVIVLKNQWYILEVSKKGDVKVKTPEGETILSSLTYYSLYQGYGDNLGLTYGSAKLTTDSTILISGYGSSFTSVNILLTVRRNTSKMDVNVKTQYNSSLTVDREALIAKFEVPVSEVYLKNREVDIKRLKQEYWLDKQGVRFGSGKNSSLIYHTPGISSLQLQADNKLVFINLDYSLDHPLINVPFQADGGGKWIDHSGSTYISGMTRSDHFSIYIGYIPQITPRFMLVPSGFVSGYVFTEHADGGNIRTHRAAYFGSEYISDPLNATGGFAGHEILVTKSVFYEDFDEGFSSSSKSYKPEERQILEFLDKIYEVGNYDLCLHTPDYDNSNRMELSEAIEFMDKRYDARTWIDHGMFPGNNNRETFVCDGLDPSSEFYAADLWKQYSTDYFWSPAVEVIRFSVPVSSLKEDLLELRLKSFFEEFWNRYRYLRKYKGEGSLDVFAEIYHLYTPKLELNSQRPNMGSAFPTPLYWQNITSTEKFYSWPTEFDYNGISRCFDEANLEIELRHLDILKSDRGFFFNHGYYVRNGIHDDILIENNGELLINPYFDAMLTYMDQLRDEGSLYITTVEDIMNYWLLIENITLDYKPDGSIHIINNNGRPVQGLSMALHTDVKSVNILGVNHSSRQVDEDAIVWFDLPAKGRATIQVKNYPLLKP